jgi:hypothetical protein
MGGNIPRPIKVEVIRKWLQGKSRDQIAKEVGIGAGTVSSIINECTQNDPEFDLMRQVAVKMKNKGYTVESFVCLVRIREKLIRELLDNTRTGTAGGDDETKEADDALETQQIREDSELEEKLESLLEALQVFCFKQNLSIKDFVDAVHQLCCTANNLGVPLERLPGHVKQLESDADRLTEEVEEKKLEKQEALEDYDVTLESLEEYMENRPLFETNEKLRDQLDQVTKERDNYKTQLARERFDREVEDYNTWAMSEIELEEANDMLGLRGYPMDQRLDLNKLKEIVMDIYQRPTKYIDTLKQFMRTRQELWNKEAR